MAYGSDRLKITTHQVNQQKSANSISPNLIHRLDSSYFIRLIQQVMKVDKPLVSIYNSF